MAGISKEQLIRYRQDAAGYQQSVHGSPGCMIGATVDDAYPTVAIVPRRTKKKKAEEGGFSYDVAPTATILKNKAKAAPQQGWFFYDGADWWIIDDVKTADTWAEYFITLKPMGQN